MNIPVVFATDQNYLFFTCVAITSMAKSAKSDTFYQIYILADQDFTDEEKLLDKLQKKYSNICIKMLFVNNSIFENVVINNSHVTKVTFYRLALCELLKEDKCLYLDADIIVTEDLSDLYQIDLQNYYIAGCRDLWIDFLEDHVKEERRKKAQIPSLNQYVNAGVLLFNLKQLREDKMNLVFNEHLNKNYSYEDQDIINVCCYNRILFLPAKWNLFTLFMGKMHEMRKIGISESTIDDFINRKGIIHYATPFIRPWEKESCWANNEWWNVAKEWEDKISYQVLRKKVDEYERRNSWGYYIEQCKSCKTIVLFGYTKYSEEFSEWIRNVKEKSEIIFCDNDLQKQGMDYKGIPVISFQMIIQKYKLNELKFIIMSQNRSGEVNKFLIEQGVKEEHIIFYKRKDKEYYSYLDERYYIQEFQDILKKEKIEDSTINVLAVLSMDELKRELIYKEVYSSWTDKYFLEEWLLKE